MAGIDSMIGFGAGSLCPKLEPERRTSCARSVGWTPNSSWLPETSPVVAYRPGSDTGTGGRVGVISAGTSDIPVAAEAALIAVEMGCDVRTTWDVGVAGIHRLVRPLEAMVGVGCRRLRGGGRDGWDPAIGRLRAGTATGDRVANLDRLRIRRRGARRADDDAPDLLAGTRGGQHRQRDRSRNHGGANRKSGGVGAAAAGSLMTGR